MDAEITHWINSFAGKDALVDASMVAVTQFGVPLLVAIVVLQWWSATDRTHVRHTAVSAGLSVLLGLACNQVILLFVHRVRPFDARVSHLLIARSLDWSFPSDHATAAIAIAASFALRGLPRRAFGLFGLAALVCLSRVFVGTHYAGDVAGGIATGFGAVLAVRLAYREGTKLDSLVTNIL